MAAPYGALGVVAAVEAVASLVSQLGRPLRILEAVAICEEEGSRFNTNFWGARAIADRIEPDEASRARDADGVTLADAMRGVGLDPANVAQAIRRDIDTFVELHVEQGSILEEEGPRLGASAMMLAIADVAREMGPPAVATVGTIAVEPAQVNVVPGLARFTVDARHSENAQRTMLVADITRVCKVAGRERDLSVDVRTLRDRPAVQLNERAADVARRACLACGVAPRDMTSGAGHDAQVLSAAAHAAMIFVPSIGGRSHCPEEATAAEDVILGTRALAAALRDLAYS